jgi:NAD(P) transhydrogenase subunit alpha
MLTTAAGTIKPARVLVLGAGVAGLMAIATTRRLGAIVTAYDVRRAAKEEVLSLGARFVDMPFSAESQGGYARELSAEEKQQQQELLAQHVAMSNIVITTAAVPGKMAPRLINTGMVERMMPGAVIVDLAAETGGNCELTRVGAVVEHGGVRIFGPRHITSELAPHASEMYARNLFHFLTLLSKNGTTLDPDWQDEILRGAVLTGGKK